jgi:long-chain acyl-CoA synthetase
MNLAELAETNLAEFGEYERLIFEGRGYTNGQLHDLGCRLAAGLIALGLSPDDRVVLILPNCPEVLASYPAVWRAGLTVIPVLFLLEASELTYILENSGAKVVITSPEICPKVSDAARGLANPPKVIVTGSAAPPPGCLSFDAIVGDNDPLGKAVPRSASDVATILYTSGTTGRPKGVVQTHDNLYANSRNAWNTMKTKRLGEMTLLVLPLAHTFGLSVLISGYLFGVRSVLMRWFDPDAALALIERHKVKYMAGVPTMFVYMLMHPNAGKYDTSSVERWLVGAAPMPVEQLKAFEAKFGGTMYVGYGLSEASPSVAGEREGMPRKPGSTGVPIEGVRVKIVDDAGHELPRGAVGEICAQGRNVSPGYLDNPHATAETFRDGWLFTGDCGYLDDDGYLFIVERKKDLVIRGGLNVYPKDVEEVLYRHPHVLETAVVGVPDLKMGEEVCAYVVLKEGVTATSEEIIAHCQTSLAKYKTPRYVEFVRALPKTGIGKVQKKELRKLAAVRFAK